MTLYSGLREKIRKLSETVWINRGLSWEEVENWLDQFEDEENQNAKLQLLFLLSNFMYFGINEFRAMLKSLYRDIYKYPIIRQIRKSNGNTRDQEFLESEFKKELAKTHFLGFGNPSESGTHLLYFFRQENELSKNLFINGHEIFHRDSVKKNLTLKKPGITRYVFIDDLAITGSQALTYSEELVQGIKDIDPNIKVSYYVLFASDRAIQCIENNSSFDEVKCLFELDQSYKCFENDSRYYQSVHVDIDRELTKRICTKHDGLLSKAICIKNNDEPESLYVLGFDQSQMLIAFYHNTPDNVPPVFWYDGAYNSGREWRSIFHRYHKVY